MGLESRFRSFPSRLPEVFLFFPFPFSPNVFICFPISQPLFCRKANYKKKGPVRYRRCGKHGETPEKWSTKGGFTLGWLMEIDGNCINCIMLRLFAGILVVSPGKPEVQNIMWMFHWQIQTASELSKRWSRYQYQPLTSTGVGSNCFPLTTQVGPPKFQRNYIAISSHL